MKRITIPVTLVVKGPVITKSSSIGGFGLDALMACSEFRNPATSAIERRYYLPGTLVKGLVREAWQELSTLNGDYDGYVREWMGRGSPEKSNDSPQRGRLRFSDFTDFGTPFADAKTRHRIQVDECRGAADAQKLQVMESPYAAGKRVRFTGKIRFLISDEESERGFTSKISDALKRGLCWMRAAGGNRTVGFGEIQDAEVGPIREESPLSPLRTEGPVWNLRLTFEEPVMISDRRIAENFFESGDIIPGGAIKGALAEMLRAEPAAFEELRSELHRVGFTHAFPAVKGGSRPAQWPLSLLAFGDGDIFDVIDVIRNDDWTLRDEKAGAFDIDWKDPLRKEVREAYRWPKVKRELRVRVSIDSAVRMAADQELFAWRMLMPHETEWVARVDTSALSDAARGQLEQVLRFGVEPIGKTKALATIGIEATEPPAAVQEDTYVVTLQTPAMLINPARHLAPDGGIGSAREADLRAELSDAWRELGGGALELVHYYQRCALAGGEYFRRRFLGDKTRYRPYLLSNAGSTFLLKAANGREGDAIACLKRWTVAGLPLAASIRSFYGISEEWEEQWRYCPYLPENGYGEIAVNQAPIYPEA